MHSLVLIVLLARYVRPGCTISRDTGESVQILTLLVHFLFLQQIGEYLFFRMRRVIVCLLCVLCNSYNVLAVMVRKVYVNVSINNHFRIETR